MTRKENTAYSTLAQDFNLLTDEPLAKYTSFNIGGPADLIALPEDKYELKQLIKRASDLNIPVTVLGGGTNLLITDKGVRGLVIITRNLKSSISLSAENQDHHIQFIAADAGERLSKVCRFAADHSLSGLEFAAGIPGTVGGAIVMNAGTPSGEMSDIVESIDILDKNTLTVNTIKKNGLNFSYRHLNITGIIVTVKFRLKEDDSIKIEETIKQNLSRKNATQPVSFASAGCFFKNPAQGMSAGELIEKSDLKGMRINDAMVSQVHANYIVNMGNATYKDIMMLKRQIQDSVFEKYQVKLETEVRVKGE